jgi:hypothetical protein
VPSFNWIDRLIGEITKTVGWMMSEEAEHGQTVEGHCDLNEDVDRITGPARKYPWWTPRKIKEDKKNASGEES